MSDTQLTTSALKRARGIRASSPLPVSWIKQLINDQYMTCPWPFAFKCMLLLHVPHTHKKSQFWNLSWRKKRSHDTSVEICKTNNVTKTKFNGTKFVKLCPNINTFLNYNKFKFNNAFDHSFTKIKTGVCVWVIGLRKKAKGAAIDEDLW